jgi:hypothetical protein
MLRNFARTACLLALASLCLASTASAVNFTAASYPVKLSGSQSGSVLISVGGGGYTCSTAVISGELVSATETVTFNPTFSGCTAFGFVGINVTGFSSTGCSWRYHTNGELDQVCSSGDVQWDAGPCITTFEASKNQDLKSVTATNNAPSAGKVTLHFNITNTHAVVTSGFGCPVAGGTYSNASITGSYVIEGKNSKGNVVAIDVQ